MLRFIYVFDTLAIGDGDGALPLFENERTAFFPEDISQVFPC